MKRLIAACALMMLATAGCRPRPQVDSNGATPPVQSTGSGGIGSTSYAPDPGPFQTVEIKNPDGTTWEAMQARGEMGQFGGTLRLSSFGGGPKTFNPWVAADVESHGLGFLLFERLIDTDAWTGQYTGRLVKSFEISPDNLTYTFTMRKGLKWSDGHDLTAEDVVFTLNKIVKEGIGNSSNRDVLLVRGKFPDVALIDRYTFRITTPEPFAPLLSGLGLAIAPKHILEPKFKSKTSHKGFYSFWDIHADPSSFVGSGPFKLKRYVAGQRVELERNPLYFMVDKKGQRLPYLDRMVVTIVPDQNAQTLKFLGGEIDMLDVRSVRGNDVALLRQRQKGDNFALYNLGPDDGSVFMIVNMCRRNSPKNKKPYVDPVKQKWFNSQKFRQALSHAINRQRIIDNVLKGVGVPLYTAESPVSLFFNADLKGYPQDLEHAAALLKEDGFIKKSDGRLYDADGHAVEFNLTTNAGNTARDGTCIAIQDELKKLGIKVNYQPVDFNMLVDKIDNSLDWEAVVMGLSGSRIEPYNGANVWKSNGRLHMFDQRLPDDNGNVSAPDARDWEKRIDELFDDGATTLEFAQRKKIFDEFQRIAYDQQPFIYLNSPLDITAVRNTIGNYKPSKYGILYTPIGSLHNMEEIFLKSAKQQQPGAQ